MPGENFSRRVARAAAVGGGRSYRSQAPRGWFALLLVICLAGVALVAYSRYERTVPPPAAARKPAVPPTTSNEWQAALAVDICGKLLPNAFPATVTSLAGSGWQTLAGGVVDLQPALATAPSQVEGAKATFASYFAAEGIGVSAKVLSIPGVPKKSTTTTSTTTTSTSTTTTTTATAAKSGSSTSTTTTSAPTTTTTTVPALGPNRVYTVGTSKCSGSPGAVVAELWQSPTASKGTLVAASKVGSLRFKNGQLLTVGFVARGTASLPKPPGARSVQQFLIANPLGKVTQTITPSTITPSTITPSTTPATTGSTSTGSATTASSTSPSSSSTTSTSKP